MPARQIESRIVAYILTDNGHTIDFSSSRVRCKRVVSSSLGAPKPRSVSRGPLCRGLFLPAGVEPPVYAIESITVQLKSKLFVTKYRHNIDIALASRHH